MFIIKHLSLYFLHYNTWRSRGEPNIMQTEENRHETSQPQVQEENMGTPIEFKMPSPLQFDSVGNMLGKWINFKQQLKIFITAAGLDRVSELRKSAILLNCMGPEGQNIYYNLMKKSNSDTPKFDDLVKEFDAYFEPKQNELINTFKFNNRIQTEGESFDSFYSDLRRLVKNCNFQDLEERMLRDRIVIGIFDKKVQKKLLESSNLTLDLAVDRCRAAELSEEHMKTMQRHEESLMVDVVQSQRPEVKYNSNYSKDKNDGNSKNNYSRQLYRCKKCAYEHGPRRCPAFGKTCTICKKLNHFAQGCRFKKVDFVEQSKENGDNSVHDL